MSALLEKAEIVKRATGSIKLTPRELGICGSIKVFAQYYGADDIPCVIGIKTKSLFNKLQGFASKEVFKIGSVSGKDNEIFLYKSKDPSMAGKSRKDLFRHNQGIGVAIWFENSNYFIEMIIKNSVMISVPFLGIVQTYNFPEDVVFSAVT